MNAILPIPKCDISIRVATMEDLPFLDGLQKKHNRALGYFPTKQFAGYIEGGHVLVAAQTDDREPPHPSPLPEGEEVRVGYIISRDRYLKRDELGIIYQLCVEPGAQRKLVGAALVQAVFDRSAYGCRLYCCWCAQDLEANWFWESLGFVPIAFRGGSTGRKRVHIFWQRRVRAGDTTTPWWFPAKTESGAMREDRLVFPIPPGLSWRDPMPVLAAAKLDKKKHLPAPGTPAQAQKPTPRPRARVQFRPPEPTPLLPEIAKEPEKQSAGSKPAEKKPPATKIDPKLVQAARELRDRYLERINSSDGALLPRGKYAPVRQITHAPASPAPDPKQLPQAA